MGCCASEPAEKPRPPTPVVVQEDPRIVVPSDTENEDPKTILLAALLRFTKTADPNFSEAKLRQFCGSYEHCFEMRGLAPGHVLFRTDQDEADGLYVVISGELSITDYASKSEVMRIFKKDFYMDVECLYGMKALYDVTAYDTCSVWVIPKNCVQELLEGVKTPHILQWYVRRRYPPNLSSLNRDIVYKKITVSVMQQVPLFSRWQESTIEAFIEYMGETPMELYNPRSILLRQGDEGGDMHILVRGSANFKFGDESFLVEESDSGVIPFCEEGIFNEEWKHKLSVVADAPCYIITINKHWIWDASDHVWEFAEGAEPHWTNAVKKWKGIIKEHKTDLYTGNYAPYLTIELLYQWLKSTASFRRCQARYVYELAKCGDALLLEKDSILSYDQLRRACLLVLKGELQLVTEKQLEDSNCTPHHIYRSQSFIYYQNLESNETLFLQGRTDCLLIQVTMEDIENEMIGLPRQPIEFMLKKNQINTRI